jgi:hypothetical protein
MSETPRSRSGVFLKLVTEFGDAAEGTIRDLYRRLGSKASAAAIRKGLEQKGFKPIRGLSDNPASRAVAQAATPPTPREKPLAVRPTATPSPKPREKPLAARPTPPAAPENPLSVIKDEYGADTARRVREYIEPDAPLAAWREMADRFALAENSNFAARPASPFVVRPAGVATDPRIETRKGELDKITNLETEIAPRVSDPVPDVSIFDMEGMPYITSMSDLSAAGDDILSINQVPFREPFSRRGGQDYMFDNPGEVWASDLKPAREHVELAGKLRRETGKDVAFLPWTMGPLSVKFSHQPRGIQYSFADAAMEGADRSALEAEIRNILPGWRSFDDPESADVFMSATGKARGALNTVMDRFRSRGGLGIGEGIYAATDLSQIGAPLTSLRNVGVIDPSFSVRPSSHASYRFSVPGEGRGRLRETNLGVLALDPDLIRDYGYKTPFDFPVGVVPGVKSPMRSYQMGPQSGIITDEALRLIESLQDVGVVGR